MKLNKYKGVLCNFINFEVIFENLFGPEEEYIKYKMRVLSVNFVD